MKIIKGDNVLVISGKDRAKTGKVLKSLPREGRIVVEGVNIAKKSQKPRKQGQTGQIISLPRSISASNVKLICPKCGKAVRVGYKRSPKVIPKNEKLCASARNASLKSRKSKRYGTLIRKIQKRGSAGIDGEFNSPIRWKCRGLKRLSLIAVSAEWFRVKAKRSKKRFRTR